MDRYLIQPFGGITGLTFLMRLRVILGAFAGYFGCLAGYLLIK